MGSPGIQQSFEVYARLTARSGAKALTKADRQLLKAASLDGNASTLTADEIRQAGASLRAIAPESRGTDQIHRVQQFLQKRIDELLVQQFQKMVMVSDDPDTLTREHFDGWLKATLPKMAQTRWADEDENGRRIQGAVMINGQQHVINVVLTKSAASESTHVYLFSIEGPSVHRTLQIARRTKYSYDHGSRYAGRAATMAEVWKGTTREVTYTDARGRVSRAGLSATSDQREITGYAKLVARFGIDHGLIKDSHKHDVTPPKQVDNVNNGSLAIRYGPGFVFAGDNHGAESLAQLIHQKRIHWDRKITMRATPRQLLQGYQYALTLSADPKALPRIIIPGSMAGTRNADSYKLLLFMAKKVPVAEWGKSWTNLQGQSLTIHQVMQRAAAAYAAWDGDTGSNRMDHSYYHLPDVLTTYYEKAGKDPTPVKDQFMARELATALGKLQSETAPTWAIGLSDVGHFTETLGVLAQSKKVQWTDQDRAQIKAWITGVRKYLRAIPQSEIDQEFSHVTKGLVLLEKHFR